MIIRWRGKIWRFLASMGVLALGAAAIAGGAAGAVAATAAAVYVSPSGNDANPGTASAPVRTLQRAQALVRGLNPDMTADVTVDLENGFYRMTSPLTLTAADRKSVV